MNKEQSYLTGSFKNSVHSIVQGIDKDVERGEDILMLGLCLVMMSTFLAPIAPPIVVLPLVSITFAITSGIARRNYQKMHKKLSLSIEQIDTHEQTILKPIAAVFNERPPESLSLSYNPIKNLKRTAKSILGAILVNPLWMPIFYVMGIQIGEERNLGFLNLAIIGVEQKIAPKVPENG